MTTKIHMLADALGRPSRLIVTAGQIGDVTQAEALLEGRSGAAALADKAYDSNALRDTIAGMKAEAVIPSNRSRKVIIPHDAEAYRTATVSSAASTASNTFAASPPAMIGGRSTLTALPHSPPQ
ncbi:transposase [Sinorhizobium terangae]|uniref:transposase n=1 Tax=Sinorhizobium terangae TaxID=110322 RepID=UPI00307E718E